MNCFGWQTPESRIKDAIFLQMWVSLPETISCRQLKPKVWLAQRATLTRQLMSYPHFRTAQKLFKWVYTRGNLSPREKGLWGTSFLIVFNAIIWPNRSCRQLTQRTWKAIGRTNMRVRFGYCKNMPKLQIYPAGKRFYRRTFFIHWTLQRPVSIPISLTEVLLLTALERYQVPSWGPGWQLVPFSNRACIKLFFFFFDYLLTSDLPRCQVECPTHWDR